MSRHLVGTVHVQDENGNDHAFGPDDEVPAWAAEKITNPGAWDGPAEELEPAGPKPPAGNAGDEKWRAYAVALGVPEAEVAKLDRDAVKDLLKKRAETAAAAAGQ